MSLSLRAKLAVIVGTTAFAFVILIVASTLLGARVEQRLATVEGRLLPKVELGPRLSALFEHLGRGLQDAVAANDPDALVATRAIKDDFLEQLATARGALDPVQADRLGRAVDDYFRIAMEVSRRLLAEETGEPLVAAMADMQTRRGRVAELIKSVTTVDRAELAGAFAAVTESQTAARRVRLVISFVCLLSVLLLSLRLSRGVLASVQELTAGLKRFAKGDFGNPIVGVGGDELGQVAEQANQMAASLDRLARERDRTDWLKTGYAGLTRELRGELEPQEVGERAIRFVARTLEAGAGALYYADPGGALRLLGQYAWASLDAGPESVPRFQLGEGLVGQAALQDDIMVVKDPPTDYLRVRSGLGEGAPRVIVLLPLIYVGRVTGVIELALFGSWEDRGVEFLMSIRETLAIAIEVAGARAATRQLLAETQRQAQRLSTQEEELRANNDELQNQQEELRQTNEELTQQTEELEAQGRALEERNSALDLARADLEQKAVELTTVSAYKSQFLANMSHELRTPLNSMLLLSNLLAMNEAGNLTDKQVEYSSTIYGAGRDLLALINQVLDLAKIEAGKTEIHVAPLALQDLARSLERVFLPLARDKGLRLTVNLAAGLPEVISTDRQRVEQILNNLLANAIKFTERGEVSLSIQRPGPDTGFRRGDLARDDMLALVVSDTGLGIAAENQERIFAPFEQIDSAPDRRYGGTGLGLNIARELAQLLGGELQMKSALGKGSTFIFYLPVGRRADDNAAPPGLPPAPVAAEAAVVPAQPSLTTGALPTAAARSEPPREATLLIIEDDRRFAEVLGALIEGQGLKYRIAPDGRTGLSMARDKERRPTAIILDVMLPDIDGWAVLEELRADPSLSTIPVQFISGVDAAEHGSAVGGVGYLRKPASREDLIRMVQSLAPESIRRACRILLVEEGANTETSLASQLAGERLDLHPAASARDALELLARERFACMILDLSLPDMDGLAFLRAARDQCGAHMPSVVVYTARPLSKAEAQVLEGHTEAVVLKEGSSGERLLDEVRMFVRRLNEGLGRRRAVLAPRPVPGDVRLKGKKILIADDDMRTIYALSALLRAKGAEVVVADTGHAAVAQLGEHPDVKVVLMDIMMPEMDGYEAMRSIRRQDRFAALPIIALTAKAMKGDEEHCVEAGATSYLAKPIDPDRLIAMLHSLLAGDKADGAPRGP